MNGNDYYGRRGAGDWIQTYSGLRFYVLDPKPEDICIEDIASALANAPRFAGHTSRIDWLGIRRTVFYSVAEHSVRVAWALRDKGFSRCIQYAGLNHDDSDAYIGDMPRPFKYLPEFQFFRDAEHNAMIAIAATLEFAYPKPEAVNWADNAVLGSEARDLMSPCIDDWHLQHPCLPTRIRPWSPRKAKREFLKLFYELNPLGIKPPPTIIDRILRWWAT